MPSLKKTLHFVASVNLTAISVALLGYGMSTEWAISTMKCSRKGDGHFNGSASLTFGLFTGRSVRDSCPTFGGDESFDLLVDLGQLGGASLALHGLVIGLLALCLLCSAGSILITLYNSVSNPYETYMGPIGLYTCSSASACMSLVVLILYVVNITVTSMSEDLVQQSTSNLVDLEDKTSKMSVGYYLLIPYMVLSLLAILMVYLYEHAAYTQKKEQQRPTEDAPKEIMMY